MSFGIPVRNGLGVGLLASTFLSSLRIGGRPALMLNFVNTTALDSRITFTRTTTATVTGSNGVIQSSAINAPRFDYDPVTLASKGLLIEEQRINLLLNSLIDGTSLSTQSVTVAAVAHTISFYGTGTITLAGAAVATVTGTGVYPNRQTLTFTPIVGVLVCTVSGSVQYAQLEAAGTVSSFIPTAGTAVTRAPDIAVMTGTNFSSWYNANEGSFLVGFDVTALVTAAVKPVFAAHDGTVNTNRVYLNAGISGQTNLLINSGGVSQASILGPFVVANTPAKSASAYKVNSFALVVSNSAIFADTAGSVPVGVNKLDIGSFQPASAYLNGHVRTLTYYNTRLPDATLRALTV